MFSGNYTRNVEQRNSKLHRSSYLILTPTDRARSAGSTRLRWEPSARTCHTRTASRRALEQGALSTLAETQTSSYNACTWTLEKENKSRKLRHSKQTNRIRDVVVLFMFAMCNLNKHDQNDQKFPAWATVSFDWNAHLVSWDTRADGCPALVARRRPSSSASTHEASRRPRAAPSQAWALKTCAVLLVHPIKITEHEGKATTNLCKQTESADEIILATHTCTKINKGISKCTQCT